MITKKNIAKPTQTPDVPEKLRRNFRVVIKFLEEFLELESMQGVFKITALGSRNLQSLNFKVLLDSS